MRTISHVPIFQNAYKSYSFYKLYKLSVFFVEKVKFTKFPVRGRFSLGDRTGVLKVYIQRSEWELSSTSKGPK